MSASNLSRMFSTQRLFVSLILSSLTLLNVSCSTDETIEGSIATNPVVIENTSYDYSSDELQMLNLVNIHRAEIGLAALSVINLISVESAAHNQYMIEHNEVTHALFNERVHTIMAALNATNVNENLAYNYSSPEGALEAWLESEDHRQNVEGDFTNLGISISRDPETDKPYYTMIFVRI